MIEKCCCSVWVWWELIKLVRASCFYTCLENPQYFLYLLIVFLTYLVRGGGRVGVLVFSEIKFVLI